jgi:stage II sporulation protein D
MQEKWQNDFDTYYNKIKQAVNATKDEVMTYDGDVIESFYFAMSNGYTEDAMTVFSENLPYLESIQSKWDNESLNNFEVINNLSTDEFCQKLNINCNNIVINNQIYDDTGRTKEITINSTTFSGTKFRKLLNLRSTDFEITISDNEIIIKTKGYGHGVGMSQYGANGMASEGYDCYEILKYYYKNIEIEKL